jgi:hypothetical protein
MLLVESSLKVFSDWRVMRKYDRIVVAALKAILSPVEQTINAHIHFLIQPNSYPRPLLLGASVRRRKEKTK